MLLLYHMDSMCVYLPLQHKENRALTEKLNVVGRTHALERERLSRETEYLHRSEEKARAKAETLPSLLEKLSFLHQELEKTQKEKEDMDDQAKAYKQQTQQVGLLYLILI